MLGCYDKLQKGSIYRSSNVSVKHESLIKIFSRGLCHNIEDSTSNARTDKMSYLITHSDLPLSISKNSSKSARGVIVYIRHTP
jgi:hypothetical protein